MGRGILQKMIKSKTRTLVISICFFGVLGFNYSTFSQENKYIDSSVKANIYEGKSPNMSLEKFNDLITTIVNSDSNSDAADHFSDLPVLIGFSPDVLKQYIYTYGNAPFGESKAYDPTYFEFCSSFASVSPI